MFWSVQASTLCLCAGTAYFVITKGNFNAIVVPMLWCNLPFMAHFMFLGSTASPAYWHAALYAFLSSACILIGGAAYFSFIPERWVTGEWISFAGNSHNWLHVFSILCCYLNTFGTMLIADAEAAL